ncbi:MAG TPA: hypothetical protein VOA64_20940 [Candidatus Dormibacteraeota bacterium]|nr:hypothetical protein [Candidatus Dormibacteraeota bacterium]
MAEQREHLYSALAAFRNTELTVYATRYNVQAAINTGAAAGGLAAAKGPAPASTSILVAIGCGGIVLAVIWLGFAVLGKKLFVDGWDHWIFKYETKWLKAHNDLLFAVLHEREARSPIHPEKLKPNRVSLFLMDRIPKSLQEWFAVSNLNLLERILPLLFVLFWLFFLALAFRSVSPSSGSLGLTWDW